MLDAGARLPQREALTTANAARSLVGVYLRAAVSGRWFS